MNVKLLRRIKKHILAEPKRFAMGFWVRRKEDSDDGKVHDYSYTGSYARCGTAACIGGWAMILSGENPQGNTLIQERAAELIGIQYFRSDRLFDASRWPEEFQRFASAKKAPERAQIAAARIEHFIKTNGRE